VTTQTTKRKAIRKRWPRGTWMTLTSVDNLLELMERKDFNMARLARYAGCSRQFIWQVCKGKKKSMTPKIAENIAEALDVPLGVLFVPSVASGSDQNVNQGRRAA
jgi:transcriptional regulator with XRE-family HTH domain